MGHAAVNVRSANQQDNVTAAVVKPDQSRATLPALLLQRLDRRPDEVAMRVKLRGIYREYTWYEYITRVERIALGLIEVGFKPGDRGAIIGDACPEWLFSELALMAVGGICFGIYSSSSPSQVAMLLKKGGSNIIFVKDQEYLDKVLDADHELTLVKTIVVFDPQGISDYQDERIIALDDFMQQPTVDTDAIRGMCSNLNADDPALIVFTSGTTGEPRGATHSHRTLIEGSRDYRHCLVPDGLERWRSVSYLPLNHIFEQYNTVLLPLLGAVVPHFGSRLSSPTETVYEVGPQLYASVPRYWQKMADHILVGLENTSWLKRCCYGVAMKFSMRYLNNHWDGKTPLHLRLAYELARYLVFQPILNKVGMKYLEVGVTAGGSIPHEVQTLWQSWGINLKNLYGQTEAGFVSAQPGQFPRPGDAGIPAPGVKLKLSTDGEVLVKSSGSFIGYWQDHAATTNTMIGDWVATGDVCNLTVDGRLRIVDRKRDIFVTQGGKNISPQQIEDRLRSNPYISEAIVFGDGEKYLVALIEIEPETVSQWARANGHTFGGLHDLTRSPVVRKLIESSVREINRQLSSVEQVKEFRILPRLLDPELEGEPVTPTRKVKRSKMYDCFRDLVDSMYERSESSRIVRQFAAMTDSNRGV